MKSHLKILGIFLVSYICLSVILAIVSAYVFEISAADAIFAFMASIISGQFFAHLEERQPSGLESWRYVVLFTILVVVLAAIQLAAGGEISGLGALSMAGPTLWFALFYLVAIFLACRLFFPMGTKNEMKARAKKADKG